MTPKARTKRPDPKSSDDRRLLGSLVADLLQFTPAEGSALDDTAIADLTQWLRNVRSAKHTAAARDVTPHFKAK